MAASDQGAPQESGMTESKGLRTCLVTGGTEGIGRAVCLELARRGDRVLFVGRDEERAREVMAAMQAISATSHVFIAADLSRLSETARVASEIATRVDRLDAAVLCAGILSTIPEWTDEGLERSFVLNYLTRYLLVRRLLPQLLEAPSGRVVLVSNAGQYPDTLDFADLQHRRGKPGLAVSGRTQFANDLFAVELADRVRGTSLQVSCVFPGLTRTRVFANARGLPWLFRLLAPVIRWFGHSPQTAAITPVFLAHSADAGATNGRFFGPRLREIAVPPRALRRDRRLQLWEASEALTAPFPEAKTQPAAPSP